MPLNKEKLKFKHRQLLALKKSVTRSDGGGQQKYESTVAKVSTARRRSTETPEKRTAVSHL
jgi:hypothetical protein